MFGVDQNSVDSSAFISTQREKLIDAIVIISVGEVAGGKHTDLSIATIRRIGKWKGDIFVITDRPHCFKSSVDNFHVKIITIPPIKSVINIKALKTSIFDHLPDRIQSCLYLDSDVLLMRNLETFINDILIQSFLRLSQSYQDLSLNASLNINNFDVGLFRDDKGHFFGFCSGCEKWHTGIMYLKRNHGKSCIAAWRRILLSGKFNTDQEAIDEAESINSCRNILTLSDRHLLFAKDYFALLLTSGRTFLHMTSINKLQEQDYFYREMVVPMMIKHLYDRLHKHNFRIIHKKTCDDPQVGGSSTDPAITTTAEQPIALYSPKDAVKVKIIDVSEELVTR